MVSDFYCIFATAFMFGKGKLKALNLNDKLSKTENFFRK